MNLKKLLLLASMSLAVVAFAVPASASAAEFTHNGKAAAGQEGVFSGSAGFTFGVAPTQGIHCTKVSLTIKATNPPPGTVTVAKYEECTTTSANPVENNLKVDATAVNLANWAVTPEPANDRLAITGVHINTKITVGDVVVGESTLKGGTVTAALPAGTTAAIEAVTLSGDGVTVEQGIPPAGPALAAVIKGPLTSNGTIGIN